MGFLVFVFGLFVGSFLNVIIDRLPRGESFWSGRSYCESCKHTLSASDLIPLFSYLFLRGKCRYCHTSLSYQYPLLEGLTGLIFAITYLSVATQSVLSILFTFIIVSSLIVVFFIDLYKGIIPFKIVLPVTVLTALFLFTKDPSIILTHWASAVLAAFFFFLLFYFTKGRGMGFGDVVFSFFLGLLLGFPNTILALYIAFLTGAGISLILVLLRRKKLRGSTIPFGPFLVLGTYIAFLWGDYIVDYFFQSFL